MSFLSTKEDNIAKFVKELRESFKLTDTPENKMTAFPRHPRADIFRYNNPLKRPHSAP